MTLVDSSILAFLSMLSPRMELFEEDFELEIATKGKCVREREPVKLGAACCGV